MVKPIGSVDQAPEEKFERRTNFTSQTGVSTLVSSGNDTTEEVTQDPIPQDEVEKVVLAVFEKLGVAKSDVPAQEQYRHAIDEMRSKGYLVREQGTIGIHIPYYEGKTLTPVEDTDPSVNHEFQPLGEYLANYHERNRGYR